MEKVLALWGLLDISGELGQLGKLWSGNVMRTTREMKEIKQNLRLTETEVKGAGETQKLVQE